MASSRYRKKSVKDVQATRLLRSNGPAIGVQEILLADSATSGPYWTGVAPDPNTLDTHRSPGGMPMTEQPVATITKSLLKIKIRRGAKEPEAQPPPIAGAAPLLQATGTLKEPGAGAPYTVSVRDLVPDAIATRTTDSPVGAGRQSDIVVLEGQGILTTMEVEDSDIEEIISLPQKRVAVAFPEPESKSYLAWNERCRERILDRREPLDEPFTGVSAALLRDLEDARKARGGLNGILNDMTAVAHTTFVQQVSRILKEKDGDEGSEVEDSEEESRDLLECVRQVMLVEAKIRESSNAEGLTRKNQKESSLKMRTVGQSMPPGGLLEMIGVPGESIPTMGELRIEQYSNAVYWQFAPYLEQEFRTELEDLYQPNDQGHYDIDGNDLKHTRTSLERRVTTKRLATKPDKLSLQLAPNDEAMEETATADTIGPWEQHIINHLISRCDDRGLDPVNEDDSSSNSEDSDFGDRYDDDQSNPVAKFITEKRRRKQKEKQDAAGMYPSNEGNMTGKEEAPSYIKRPILSQEDLQVATDLWDTVINPACIDFEKQTGKPAEAMRDAIAGVITRRVTQSSPWNEWQKLWWNRLPKVHDQALRKELGARCHEEYQLKTSGLDNQAAMDSWTQTLKDDVAKLHDLDAQGNNMTKVIDLADELVKISSRAARDYIHVLFLVCSVNPYSLEAQAMSGIGVGSNEMRSVLMDNGQLQPLSLMLNDLKTKVGNLELENRKAGILPPAFGQGGMLRLPERTGSERLDPLTKFKLFECKNAIDPSDSIPGRATSRSCKKPRVDDNANENDSHRSSSNTARGLSPLLANDALAQAVSQVQLPMDGWVPLHIFKLFVVLVYPPPGLDLGAIGGLGDYLTQLLAGIGSLVGNGIRGIVCHCWWALMMLCDDSNTPRKRADWVPILNMLKKSRKRLVNWCSSISFPSQGGFPKSRHSLRNMVHMFFNPDPARRLRLIPIEGPITDDTPVIINPVVLGGACLACTVAGMTTTVDPSIVPRLCRPPGAVRGPDPTPQSAATAPTIAAVAIHKTSSTTLSASPHGMTSVGLLPMTQGLGISPPDTLHLGLDFLMSPRDFEASNPSYLFPVPPESVYPSGTSASLYENDAHNFPFNPLESTISMFIPPSNMGIFDPRHATSLPSTSQKRVLQPVPAHDERNKRRKLDKHLVDQQLGGLQVDHRSVAVTSNASNTAPSIGLPAANQSVTNAIISPIPAASFDCPDGMSRNEYVTLLRAKLAGA